MHLATKLRAGVLIAATCLAVATTQAQTSTFSFSTPGYYYAVNGGATPNPTLSLQAGNTYTFSLDNVLSVHPMVILTDRASTASLYSGASPTAPGGMSSGVYTLTIPATGYPSTLYYECAVHQFYGTINVTPPAAQPPPPNTIVSVSVTTNVVLVSTGTNTTWMLVPEYNSNVVSGTWAAVPAYTNTFANGTNVTVFNRLEAICGPQVYLRIRQSPP